jgi:hypothetical protein
VADSVNRLVPIAEQSATLIAREREAFFEDLRQERIDVLFNIERRRMATLTELESVGNRILGKAQRQTEQLIDHLFFRMLQLIAISLLCMVVLVVLLGRLKGKRKGGPINAD